MTAPYRPVQYRVTSVQPATPGMEIEIQASAYQNEPGTRWTLSTAIDYCRREGALCPVGTMHYVLRWRGQRTTAWTCVRAYVTRAHGIVQKTHSGIGLREAE